MAKNQATQICHDTLNALETTWKRKIGNSSKKSSFLTSQVKPSDWRFLKLLQVNSSAPHNVIEAENNPDEWHALASTLLHQSFVADQIMQVRSRKFWLWRYRSRGWVLHLLEGRASSMPPVNFLVFISNG